MGKFNLVKRVDLSGFDPAWAGAFVAFRLPTYGEMRSIQERISALPQGDEHMDEMVGISLEFLGAHFVEGKGYDGQSLVEVAAEDLKDLPVSLLNHCFLELSKGIDPKGSEPSSSQSSTTV